LFRSTAAAGGRDGGGAAGDAGFEPPATPFFTSAGFSLPVARTAISAPTGDLVPLLHRDVRQRARLRRLVRHGRLVGLDVGDLVPALTLSPSFLCHFTTVPSVMVSDSWGMVISTGMVGSFSAGVVGAGRF
jgi:hypothetical protein